MIKTYSQLKGKPFSLFLEIIKGHKVFVRFQVCVSLYTLGLRLDRAELFSYAICNR